MPPRKRNNTGTRSAIRQSKTKAPQRVANAETTPPDQFAADAQATTAWFPAATTQPDPLQLAVAEQAIPTPTAMKAEWFPAAVRLPGDTNPLPLAKVYATAAGLYVYTRRPDQTDQTDPDGRTPHFYSPINFDKTPRPRTGYAARQAGITIHTDAGLVTVQPLGGCGCSARALKSWRPTWASRNEAWEG
jgi:hypothetical protein